MTITGQSSLDKDTIDQMVRDAEAHADEDSRRRAEAEVRNNARHARVPDREAAPGAGRQARGRREDAGRGAPRRAEDGARGHRRRGHRQGHRGAHDLLAGLHAAAVRGRRPGRPRRRVRWRASQASDDDVVDAEIVDDGETSSRVSEADRIRRASSSEPDTTRPPSPRLTRRGAGGGPRARRRGARRLPRRAAADAGGLREPPQAVPAAPHRRGGAASSARWRRRCCPSSTHATPRSRTAPPRWSRSPPRCCSRSRRRASPASIPRGQPFDPAVAEAVVHEPGDGRRAPSCPRSCGRATPGRAASCAPPW